MKRSFVASVALHFAMLCLLFRCGGGSGDGNGRGPKFLETGAFIPKAADPIEVSAVDLKDLGDQKAQKKQPIEKCEESYNGIGIMNSFVAAPSGDSRFGYLVSDVAPGYAADRAGIKPGDIIRSEEDLLGEPGTEVRVVVYPLGGGHTEMTLVREKICTKFAKPKEKP